VSADRSVARRTYAGLWLVLRTLLKLPTEPPTLPAGGNRKVEGFRPGEGWLRYLTFRFWVVLILFDGAILVGWIVLLFVDPFWAAVLAVPALIVAVVPDVIASIAIRLRYDTTWYVLSDRSLRIRRGLWTLHETTITYENVQNVAVRQGPLQRWFGIADLVVQSAGGGGATASKGADPSGGHVGVLEGLADAARVRGIIIERARRSRSAGLGDETPDRAAARSWTGAEIAVLREIRDAVSDWRRRT
jgi:membrane protein YdbS with pleckstrin-like domain